MREMKDSGIEWIGEIPKDWVCCKVKNATSFVGSGTTPTSSNQEFYDGDISWIQSGDLYKAVAVESVEKKLTLKALKSFSALHIYQAPFIVMAMYGASVGNTAFSKIDACCNQACCCIKNNEFFNLNFMYYWLILAQIDFLGRAIGGTQPNISQEKIRNQHIVKPSLEEQQQIADYLDTKCSEIYATAEDIQKEISLLEEYKKSVITEAVTKGLNPDAEMKDSGIEWIGEIPKHWKVARLKHVLSEAMKYGANETGVEYSSEMPRYIRITDISLDGKLKDTGKLSLPNNVAKEYILKDKAILFARSGATVGKTFIYKSEYGKMAFAGYLISAYCNEKLFSPELLYYFTNSFAYSEWINRVFSQSTIQNIGADKYVNMILTVPKITEQQQIVSYLDSKCSEIDSLIADKKRQLDILADYKKSLIYEYVTGKKEVPVNE